MSEILVQYGLFLAQAVTVVVAVAAVVAIIAALMGVIIAPLSTQLEVRQIRQGRARVGTLGGDRVAAQVEHVLVQGGRLVDAAELAVDAREQDRGLRRLGVAVASLT